MMIKSLFNRKITLYFLITFCHTAYAQMPVCSGPGGNLLYFILAGNSVKIYNYNPAIPYSSTNLVLNTINTPLLTMPALAVAPVLNSPSSYPTFYILVDDGTGYGRLFYHYYNGTTWVNTGHKTHGLASNFAGGGSCIYNLDAYSGKIYKYSGTGDDTLFITIPGWKLLEGGNDLMADCNDNLYVPYLGFNSGNHWLRKYSPTGVLLHTWVLSGLVGTSGGGGTAIVGNMLIIGDGAAIDKGIIDPSSDTIYLTPTDIPNITPWGDYASCPYTFITPPPDTFYYCGSGPGISFSVSGGPPYSYNILSGSAVVTGSGPSYTVTASSNATIVVMSNQICGLGTDTFRVVVPTAVVDAGIDDAFSGCGIYVDTLHATLKDTISWLAYDVAWSPAASIVSGANKLNPVIDPTGNTTYVLHVSTPPDKGGCTWIDSVHISVNDLSTFPDFTYDIRYGCSQDSIFFTNTSTAANKYQWYFGDNSISATTNPTHVYSTQGVYHIQLEARNDFCVDTITKDIDTRHPLVASFIVDKDTICKGTTVHFTNTTKYNSELGTIHSLWDFADGTIDTLANPSHIFSKGGIYHVRLVVTDFVPCSDTAYLTIIVDSTPYLSFVDTPKVICKGEEVLFKAAYSRNITSLTWNYGDGSRIDNGIYPIVYHSYDNVTGTVIVTATASSRSCPDISYTDTIQVAGYPVVSLGPDTVICPGQDAVTFVNLASEPEYYHHLWNTNDTGKKILATQPSVYWLQLTSVYGCTSTDSVLLGPSCYLAIPNVFSPNGDNINDYFFPRNILASGVARFHMQIFNRWGQLIFETNALDGRGWDGRFEGVPQLEGVYVYLIDAGFLNEVSQSYRGNVTLLR